MRQFQATDMASYFIYKLIMYETKSAQHHAKSMRDMLTKFSVLHGGLHHDGHSKMRKREKPTAYF